jgi:hypothetical protein
MEEDGGNHGEYMDEPGLGSKGVLGHHTIGRGNWSALQVYSGITVINTIKSLLPFSIPVIYCGFGCLTIYKALQV